MKSLVKIFSVLMLLVLLHLTAAAQDELYQKALPRWVPDNGYWVVSTNVNQPKQYTIFFYTNQHQLVYKERLEGVKLDLQSRKVKMRLKKVLDTSLLAWQQQRQAKENEGLVISLLQRK